jgi:hypothetical protein
MVRLTDIPAEVRWEIGTRAANSQSAVYDMLVRQLICDEIDEIWNAIMTEAEAFPDFPHRLDHRTDKHLFNSC